MSFLNISMEEVNDAPELEPLVTDEEVEFEITDATVGTNKSDLPYMLVRHKIIGRDDAGNVPTFTKYFKIPHASMTKEEKDKALRAMKYFFQAIGFEWTGNELDVTQLIGYSGWFFIGLDPNEGSEFGPQNYVKKYIAGE